jgi:hypothetical protein
MWLYPNDDRESDNPKRTDSCGFQSPIVNIGAQNANGAYGPGYSEQKSCCNVAEFPAYRNAPKEEARH